LLGGLSNAAAPGFGGFLFCNVRNPDGVSIRGTSFSERR
jgi:hypothetical protein